MQRREAYLVVQSEKFLCATVTVNKSRVSRRALKMQRYGSQ